MSIIELSGGFRLLTNRDEKRARASAEFPFQWGRAAIGPFDPCGGGTWVAARPGLTLCLLNFNFKAMPAEPARSISRGRIIPALIDAEDADDAISRLRTLQMARFVPFRLIAVGRDDRGQVSLCEARWDGEALVRVRHDALPAVFVSSGLGDEVVGDRVPLFEEMVVQAGATPQAQDAYHHHRWPNRLHQSVLMSRPDARTVSITEVCDTLDGLEMRYSPVDEAGQVTEAVLHAAR